MNTLKWLAIIIYISVYTSLWWAIAMFHKQLMEVIGWNPILLLAIPAALMTFANIMFVINHILDNWDNN